MKVIDYRPQAGTRMGLVAVSELMRKRTGERPRTIQVWITVMSVL
jgi:hypothetical protein